MSAFPLSASPDIPPPPVVLLVEDDKDTRQLYHTALEGGGFWVLDAATAGEAMSTAVDLRPDLIVTDVGLAGARDGVSLARELKQNPNTAAIPVLAVTGWDPESLGEASKLFSRVLVKPVMPDELMDRIDETLRHARTLQERSARARTRGSELVSKSRRALAKSGEVFARHLPAQALPCPTCQQPLVWSERRKMFGVTFDYYRACANGCGLFCYNHSDKALVPLTG